MAIEWIAGLVIALVFYVLLGWYLWKSIRKSNHEEWLKKHGTKISCKIQMMPEEHIHRQGFSQDSIDYSGSSSYVSTIYVQFIDENGVIEGKREKIYWFMSKRFFCKHPGAVKKYYNIGDYIDVYVNPDNVKDYYMDIVNIE